MNFYTNYSVAVILIIWVFNASFSTSFFHEIDFQRAISEEGTQDNNEMNIELIRLISIHVPY